MTKSAAIGPENRHTLSKSESLIPSLRISAKYVHLQRVTSQKITRNYTTFLLVISLTRRCLFCLSRRGGIHISSQDFRGKSPRSQLRIARGYGSQSPDPAVRDSGFQKKKLRRE